MEFALNVLGNVLANLVFWAGLGSLAWLAILTTHRKLINFFGLRGNKTLIVYLSNAYESTKEKPIGGLISEHEFHVVETVRNLFGSASYRYPEMVKGLVDSFWLGEDIKLKFLVSPQQNDKIQFKNMIVVGGASRNLVRKLYIESGYVKLTSSSEEPQQKGTCLTQNYIRIVKGIRKGEIVEDQGKYNLALIEKIYDGERRITVFMCSGSRADSSWASVEYLIRHWRDLQSGSRNRPFALCLGFPQSQDYMQGYMEPKMLTELILG